MNQKHNQINLLRAAANMLQSSLIQDENIVDLKKQITEETLKRNMQRVAVLKEMIAMAKQRSKHFLQQYADTMEQLVGDGLVKVLEDLPDENPVFERSKKVFATA